MKKLFNLLGSIEKDKLLHFVVCLILSEFIMSVLHYTKLSFLVGSVYTFSVLLLIMIGKEVYDSTQEHNKFDIADIIAGIIGYFVGLVLVGIMQF